jgi:hypothetical protein
VGLQILKEKGCTYVIKVRTDSHLDLNEMLKFYFAQKTKNLLNKVFVPAFNTEKPDLFMDYYFGSSTEILESFLEVMLNAKELYSDVHFDTFYKYVKHTQTLKIKDLIRILYRRERIKPSQYGRAVIKRAWSESFSPGPLSLYESYRWRGETFGPVHNEDLLIFDEDTCNDDAAITNLILLNLLDESFDKMYDHRTHIEVASVFTFFFSSYLEDSINKIKFVKYTLSRRLKSNIRSILNLIQDI